MRWLLITRRWLLSLWYRLLDWWRPPVLPPGLTPEEQETATEYMRLVRAAEAAGVPRAAPPAPDPKPVGFRGMRAAAVPPDQCRLCRAPADPASMVQMCDACHQSYLRELRGPL